MKKERGSFIVTLIIILLFVGAGVFYVKTSHPAVYKKAVKPKTYYLYLCAARSIVKCLSKQWRTNVFFKSIIFGISVKKAIL